MGDLKLKFITPADLCGQLKATVHKTGKLGFTLHTAKKFELNKNKSISIGQNQQDKNDNKLYIIVNDNIKEDAFKVCKAGEYYYLNTKYLFDKLGYNYAGGPIVFDISKIQHNLYCMKLRVS
jgi:hypothetical protein